MTALKLGGNGVGESAQVARGVMQGIAHGMRKEFRHIDTNNTTVILLEAGSSVFRLRRLAT